MAPRKIFFSPVANNNVHGDVLVHTERVRCSLQNTIYAEWKRLKKKYSRDTVWGSTVLYKNGTRWNWPFCAPDQGFYGRSAECFASCWKIRHIGYATLDPFWSAVWFRHNPNRRSKLNRVLYVRKENDLKTAGATLATIYLTVGGDQIRFVCFMYYELTLRCEHRKLFNFFTSWN